tara:strand:+ start:125 stop:958 length:834 start_codon:yes stop_codon:yes gene_type:complete
MLNIDFILKLYNKHISVIKNNRKNMIDRLNSKATVPLESGGKNGCGIELHSGWHPQFADTEAEITMLLLLEFKPKKVVEFSPCNGWSTALILDTLNHNNNNALLQSFDVHDICLQNIEVPNNVKWEFIKNDVKLEYSNMIKNEIDYLFIDSDHSEDFAKYYVNNLLTPLLSQTKQLKKQIVVSVHDVFHWCNNNGKASIEGKVVIDWLNNNNISYFTAGITNSIIQNNKKTFFPQSGIYSEIIEKKRELNIDSVIVKSWGYPQLEVQSNSAIFFILE